MSRESEGGVPEDHHRNRAIKHSKGLRWWESVMSEDGQRDIDSHGGKQGIHGVVLHVF